MPRASNGDYALPSTYKVNDGDTIRPAQHNPPFEDLQTAMTGSLSRDGYGAMRAPMDFGGFRGTNLAPGVNPTDAVTVSQIGGSGIPVGGGCEWFGDTPPPLFMWRDGRELSRTDYAELFAVIGTRYGSGNGATTFNLPDSRGRVEVGRDDMGGTAANRVTTAGSGINGANLGASGGAQNHTLTTDQLPAHNHPVTDPGHAHLFDRIGPGGGGGPGGGNAFANFPVATASGTTGISVGNRGGGQAHNNMQPSLVCNKIIKVRSS